MLVLKFGGTSVGKPDRMKMVADLVLRAPGKRFVVLSALSGTTNALVGMGEKRLQSIPCENEIQKLFAHYELFIDELYSTAPFKEAGKEIINRHFKKIRTLTDEGFDEMQYRELLAEGELISTELFYQHLLERQVPSVHLLPALDFMSIDADDEPELEKIEKKLRGLIQSISDYQIIITQGYICKNPRNEVDNLKRGGSDYTASLIGAALRAEEIQIWTDIDGMHNNDPRIVNKTVPVSELTFDEASELAYFGAKILHPSTIVPAQKFNIPVRLKNTMDEKAPGTIINDSGQPGTFKAVAAKDGITAVKIKSSRMLMAYGFLVKVFEVFENFKTPIDMITTSEVAVSVTIDNKKNLAAIVEALKPIATIEVDENQTIICVVGYQIANHHGILGKVFHALGDIPVRMVSFGGSSNNISLLINTSFKEKTLQALNSGLFGL